jgi:hypothetical protein
VVVVGVGVVVVVVVGVVGAVVVGVQEHLMNRITTISVQKSVRPTRVIHQKKGSNNA